MSEDAYSYKNKENLKEILVQLCDLVEVVLVQNHMIKNPNQLIAGNVNVQKLVKLVSKIEKL